MLIATVVAFVAKALLSLTGEQLSELLAALEQLLADWKHAHASPDEKAAVRLRQRLEWEIELAQRKEAGR